MRAADIAALLAGRPVKPQGGNYVVCCPAHHDKNPSLSLRDSNDGKLLVHCFTGCDPLDVLDAICSHVGGEIDQARPSVSRHAHHGDDHRHRIELARRIWNAAVDPRGTLGEGYLNGRKPRIDLPDDLCGRVLRFHPACPWEKTHVPALVAAFHPIAEPDDAAPPVAILRIGINPDGSKIDKRMLGPVAGCAIKLDADEFVTIGLGVAEGLETAMAIRAKGWRPIWCLGSAGGIEKFAPLSGIETLTIFADHDASGRGQQAARKCLARWVDAGCEVFIHTPHDVGSDWADSA